MLCTNPLLICLTFIRLRCVIVVSKCDHESRRTDSYMAHYSGCLGIPKKDHFRSRRIFTGISQRRGGPLQAAGTTAPRVRRESKVILIFWAPWLFKTFYALCSRFTEVFACNRQTQGQRCFNRLLS